jgi:hypothetical protein
MENLFPSLTKLHQMMMNMPQMQEMMDNIHLNSQSPSAVASDTSDLLEKHEKKIEQELARAKETEEYNRRTPIPCPLIDRATLLFSFNMRLQMEKPLEKGRVRMRNTWITGL